MIPCTNKFKKNIGSNMRYLKAAIKSGTESVEIKSFILKNGGMGSERFCFGTVYVRQASIVTAEEFLPEKGSEMQLVLAAGTEIYESLDDAENCTIAKLYAESSVKTGSICTVTAYGSLYFNDPIVVWDATEETITFERMIQKISDLTGKNVIIKAPSMESIESIVKTMLVKHITKQPTVRAYLAQMAESLMGYAYESVTGDYVICHGCPDADTTGMETNVLASDPKQQFSVGILTCVTSEAYWDDDGKYTAAQSLTASGTGSAEVKYRSYTSTAETFGKLNADVLKIKYTSGTVTLFGNPLLEPCDAVEYTDEHGEKHFTICAGEITQTFDGGLQTEIIAPDVTSDADQQSLDEEYTTEETERQNKQSYVKADQLEAVEATFKKAYAETVKTNQLDAAVANLGYVKSNELEAEVGKFGYVKTGELTAEVAKLGYVTAATVEAQYARLDKANIPTAWIDTAMIGAGVVGTVQIADGSITDAKIVDLTANKITVGTLSVERLIIRGSTSSLVYALNDITGALQAQSVDTINGEVLTPRTITADKIVALAITSKEIAANAITTEKLLVGAVTADKISVSDLYTIKATIGGFTIDERSIHIGTPDKIYFVEDFEIMSADDMQNLTAGEIDSVFDIGAVYIGQNMIALAYNWFKADGTFNIGKGAISFDGETISFGDSAQNKVTQICKDTVTTSYVNALKVTAGSVAAEDITGTTISGKTIVGGTIRGTSIISDSFLYERTIDASTYARFKVDSSIMEIGIFEEEGYGGNISFKNDAAMLSGETITLFSSHGTIGLVARNGVSVTCEVGEFEANCGATFAGPISATSFVNSSSQRYKTNIEDMTDDRALKLLAMRPVSYDYIDIRKGRDQLGLIAEEVEVLESYPVSYDKYNRPDGLDYSRFVPQLIKLCQIQQRQINELQKQIASMTL